MQRHGSVQPAPGVLICADITLSQSVSGPYIDYPQSLAGAGAGWGEECEV